MEGYPTHVNELVDYDFFILKLREHTSIAIKFEDDEQYIGITFYKTNLGWELNPTKIGKGFITNMGNQLDFTKDFATALRNADQTL